MLLLKVVCFAFCATLASCVTDSCGSNCENGILNPTDEVMYVFRDNVSKLQSAIYALSCSLLDKFSEFDLCDIDKNKIKKGVESQIGKCTEMCENQLQTYNKLTKAIEEDITAFKSTGTCKETQFYYPNFIQNYCTTTRPICTNKRIIIGPIKLPKWKHNKPGRGRGKGKSSDSSDGDHKRYKRGVSYKTYEKSEDSEESEESKTSQESSEERRTSEESEDSKTSEESSSSDSGKSGSGYKHRNKGRHNNNKGNGWGKNKNHKHDDHDEYDDSCYENLRDENMANDILYRFCTVYDSRFDCAKFWPSITCSSKPEDVKGKCVDYKRDVDAFNTFMTDIQIGVISCIKAFQVRIDKAESGDDLKELCA